MSLHQRCVELYWSVRWPGGRCWPRSSLGCCGAARRGPRPAPTQAKSAADPALERAREQVKMLDDLYKNAVVSITKKYVGKQDDQPAIMVAQDVFGAMKKQGWHSAKLVDATGEPLNDGERAQDRLREGGGAGDQRGQALLRPRRRRGQGAPSTGRDGRPRRHARVRRLPYPQEGGRGARLHPLRHPHQVNSLPRGFARSDFVRSPASGRNAPRAVPQTTCRPSDTPAAR